MILCAVLLLPYAQAEQGIVIPEIRNVYQFELPQNDAMAFLKRMGIGWNLGNTFDAYRGEGYAGRGEMAIESSWVGVLTSEAMIEAIHDVATPFAFPYRA